MAGTIRRTVRRTDDRTLRSSWNTTRRISAGHTAPNSGGCTCNGRNAIRTFPCTERKALNTS